MTNQSQALSNTGEGKNRIPLVLLCVLAAAVFAAFLALNPWTAAMHAKAQARLAQEIALENKTFCEKRGFISGARDYAACMSDLNDLRANHDKRTYESVFGQK
ncbi:MAG TPA: hypothetical protein VJL90_08165 [Pseudorhodoplanes sp.]|nr:hypothetical protein [Pseudorhodoplanes sp.]